MRFRTPQLTLLRTGSRGEDQDLVDNRPECIGTNYNGANWWISSTTIQKVIGRPFQNVHGTSKIIQTLCLGDKAPLEGNETTNKSPIVCDTWMGRWHPGSNLLVHFHDSRKEDRRETDVSLWITKAPSAKPGLHSLLELHLKLILCLLPPSPRHLTKSSCTIGPTSRVRYQRNIFCSSHCSRSESASYFSRKSTRSQRLDQHFIFQIPRKQWCVLNRFRI
jgi:hypothetical protein